MVALTDKEVKLSPTTLPCDNHRAVYTAGNPNGSGRSKHIDVCYLKIREWQEMQKLFVKHVPGTIDQKCNRVPFNHASQLTSMKQPNIPHFSTKHHSLFHNHLKRDKSTCQLHKMPLSCPFCIIERRIGNTEESDFTSLCLYCLHAFLKNWIAPAPDNTSNRT